MKTRALFSLVAIVALAALPARAEMHLIGPETVLPGERFEVTVEGVEIDLAEFQKRSPPQIEWRIVPNTATIRSRLELVVVIDPETQRTRWAVAPYAGVKAFNEEEEEEAGRLAVVCMVVKDGVGALAVHQILVEGNAPTPDPDPDPPPNPDPLWAVLLVEESGRRTLDLARLITSPGLRSQLRDRGLRFDVVDQHGKSPNGATRTDLAAYVAWAGRENGGLPALFVVGRQGTVHHCGPPPSTGTGVIELVDRLNRRRGAVPPAKRLKRLVCPTCPPSPFR